MSVDTRVLVFACTWRHEMPETSSRCTRQSSFHARIQGNRGRSLKFRGIEGGSFRRGEKSHGVNPVENSFDILNLQRSRCGISGLSCRIIYQLIILANSRVAIFYLQFYAKYSVIEQPMGVKFVS